MRTVGHRCLLLATAFAVAALSNTVVVAQQERADDSDPPTRAARLRYIEGAVSLQPAGVDDWTVATINRPLTSGDALWSDRGSRAQIEFGAATVSLAEDSSVTLLNLGDQVVQLRLSAGSIIVALRDPDADSVFEVDAPSASVSLMRPGSYRIGVDNTGDTTVATRDGQSQVITRAGRSVILRGGQAAQFGASGDVDVATLAAPDGFERWSVQHGQRWASDPDVSRYVSSDVVGVEDLDSYGEWVQEPDYGYTWYPTVVAVDWAPYRYGRWLWVAPWGWTWVDNAPWGYAPFHYGRWTYLGQRWGWVPAPPGSHAVYAPALVAWISSAGSPGGPGGPGGTTVGWLPLAPGEVYLPGYRVSARYLRNVNVSNTAIINSDYISNVYQNPALQDRYANRRAPRALSVVSQRSFISGKPIAAQLIAPLPQWQGVDATPRPPLIVPARQSVLGAAELSQARRPPVAIANRPVVARRLPPPAPAPFESQLDAMRVNGGRPLTPAQLQLLRDTDHPRAIILVAPPQRSTPSQPASTPMPTPTPTSTPSMRATVTSTGSMEPTPTPSVPDMPRRTPMPERHVMPVEPALPAPSATVLGSPAPPSPPADRRAIPERSPQFRSALAPEASPPPLPVPLREAAPVRQQFDRAPPQQPVQSPPPPAQTPSKGKPAPQVVRPDVR